MPSIYGATGFAVVNYESALGNHSAKLWLKVNSITDFNAFTVTLKGGGTANEFGVKTDIGAAFITLLADEQTLTSIEFYSQPTLTSDPLPIGIQDVNLVGTGYTGQTEYVMTTLTWTSRLGGIGKNIFLENGETPDFNIPWSVVNTGFIPWRAYLLSDLGAIVARDGAPCIITGNIVTKTNDSIRKKRLGL